MPATAGESEAPCLLFPHICIVLLIYPCTQKVKNTNLRRKCQEALKGFHVCESVKLPNSDRGLTDLPTAYKNVFVCLSLFFAALLLNFFNQAYSYFAYKPLCQKWSVKMTLLAVWYGDYQAAWGDMGLPPNKNTTPVRPGFLQATSFMRANRL